MKFLICFLIMLMEHFHTNGQSDQTYTSSYELVPFITAKDSGVMTNNIDEPPQFPGGQSKLEEFIKLNLKRPVNPNDSDYFKGSAVKVLFTIESTGKVSKVMHNGGIMDGGLAVKFVKSLPDWIPAKSNGKNVSCEFQLPIRY